MAGFSVFPIAMLVTDSNMLWLGMDWLFSSHFWPLLKQVVFFEATETLA